MATSKQDRIDNVMAEKERVKAAVESAVREAIRKHKQAGNPIVGMKNRKMVWLSPEGIEV